VLAVVACSWALAAWSHTAGIPRTDDWAWGRVALDLHRSGHLQLVGWGPMTMVGLVAWAQPWLALLGAHVWVLDLAASALVAAGLLATWRLARLAAGRAAAAAVVATLALAPGFLRDAASFMTDGPAFAVGALSLLAGYEAASAAGRRRQALEAACAACGWWAFTMRELAIAAPLAVLAARWWGERRRRRSLGAQAAVLVGACAALWAWRAGLPGGQPYGGRPPAFTIAEALVGVVFTASLLLVPVLAATAASWWPARHRAARAVGACSAMALAVVPIPYEPRSWSHRYQWLTGDYLDPRGINGNKLLLGSRPRVVPAGAWAAVELVAVLAGVVVLALVAEAIAVRWRAPRREQPSPLAPRVMAAYAAVTGAGVAVAIVRNGAVYDRYLWPLALAGAVLLVTAFPVAPLSRWHPLASQAAVAATGAFVALSLLVTLNSDAFDGARWRLASSAVRTGVAARSVDGGFEWVGWHAGGVADANAAGVATRPYWVAMVGEPAACIELSASPLSGPGLALVRTEVWRTWLVAGRSRLYEYRRAPACP
jgi:hypothetical protein